MTVPPAAASEAVPRVSRTRRVAYYVVLVLAALLLLLSTAAVWVNRVALNTDGFVGTSTQLIDDPAIRDAVATRAVDELYANVDVQAEIRQQLPKNLKSLSGPAAAGLRQASYQVVNRALEQPALQTLWEATLRTMHAQLVKVLEGGSSAISTQGGVVTLDLRQIVLEAADRIGIGQQVADKLPATAGRIVVLRSNQLKAAQDGFQLLKTLAWVLPLLTVVAFALAVWLAAGRRRRAIRDVGLAVFVIGVLGLVAVNTTGNYLVNALVQDHETRKAAQDGWTIVTQDMRTSLRWFVIVGLLFVLAAWIAGPGRRAFAARRTIAPAFRERLYPYVGVVIVALTLLLTGPVNDLTRFLFVVLLIVLLVIGVELFRNQTLQEFPDAGGGPAFLGEARVRVSEWIESRRATRARATGSDTAPAGDMAARLAQLADLHARGELTDEEYATAKARILAEG